MFVCATPIGNLGDVSERLRQTLLDVDLVFAEDTRRTAKLMAHVGATAPIRSLFAGNEKKRSAELIQALEQGKVVALVSDAGMPTVSDPGAVVLPAARAAGFPVEVLPGASAVTTAIALAGYGGDRFVFEGFLPRKGIERQRRIETIVADERVVVLFASPKRLSDDLADLSAEGDPKRNVTILREMTKLHEEVWSGSLEEAADHWGRADVKGEVTVVLAPRAPTEPDLESAIGVARDLIGKGATSSDAARHASSLTGVSRREIYQRLIDQGPS